MGKRANERTKPKGYVGALTIKCKDGITRNVTTWPYQKRDKKTGEQKPVPGMMINGEPA
jgi:hypothetical protein